MAEEKILPVAVILPGRLKKILCQYFNYFLADLGGVNVGILGDL